MARNRTRSAIGGTRTSALWRLVGLFALMALDAFLIPIALIAAAVYFVVDIVKSIAVDKHVSGNGMILGAMRGVWKWVLGLHTWVLFGSDFPGFLPSRA